MPIDVERIDLSSADTWATEEWFICMQLILVKQSYKLKYSVVIQAEDHGAESFY